MAFTNENTPILVDSAVGVDSSGGGGPSGEYATLQYALDDTSLSSTGSVFHISGTHSFSTPISFITHGKPTSANNPIVLKFLSGNSLSCTTEFISDSAIDFITVDGANFTDWGASSNLILMDDYNSLINITASRTTITGEFVVELGNYNIVSGCTFNDCFQGVRVGGQSLVRNCVIEAERRGVDVNGGYIFVTGNTIDTTASGSTGAGIFVNTGDRIVIEHNVIFNSSGTDAHYGIQMYSASGDSSIIRKNYMEGFKYGIHQATGSVAAIIEGNRVYDITTTDFVGEAQYHTDNSALGSSGLDTDDRTPTYTLWDLIPGIGSPTYHPP